MNAQNRLTIEEHTVDFMLAEYETLRDLRSSLISHGESRVSFFLAIVSGAVVALALISQWTARGDVVYIVSGIILVGLFFLGLITYARLVQRGIAVTIYTRGINRIRRYFAERIPNIENYLILPISDDVPSFKFAGFMSKGAGSVGLAGMVAIINSIIAATGVSLFMRLLLDLPTGLTILIGALAFAATYFAHYRYHVARLQRAEKETKVHFPTD